MPVSGIDKIRFQNSRFLPRVATMRIPRGLDAKMRRPTLYQEAIKPFSLSSVNME